MEHLFLAPFSILTTGALLIGGCLVASELAHALGLRLAAAGRRLRSRLFAP